MRQRSSDAIDRTLSWLPWVFLLYLAFVVYGSLMPFLPRSGSDETNPPSPCQCQLNRRFQRHYHRGPPRNFVASC